MLFLGEFPMHSEHGQNVTSRKAARIELFQKLITATVPYIYHLYLLFLKKESNRYRMAVDYRQLSDNLRPATCSFPNTKNCLESLAKKWIFSALDITSSFNQLELDEETNFWLVLLLLKEDSLQIECPLVLNHHLESFKKYAKSMTKHPRRVLHLLLR